MGAPLSAFNMQSGEVSSNVGPDRQPGSSNQKNIFKRVFSAGGKGSSVGFRYLQLVSLQVSYPDVSAGRPVMCMYVVQEWMSYFVCT